MREPWLRLPRGGLPEKGGPATADRATADRATADGVAETVQVLIASPLEAEYAERIAAADPRIELLYAPDLLPVPRYPCDHGGIKRDLSAAELRRWSELRAGRRRQLRLRLAGASRDPGEQPRPALDPGHERGHRRAARAHRARSTHRSSSPPRLESTACRSPSSRCSGCCTSPRAFPCCRMAGPPPLAAAHDQAAARIHGPSWSASAASAARSRSCSPPPGVDGHRGRPAGPRLRGARGDVLCRRHRVDPVLPESTRSCSPAR